MNGPRLRDAETAWREIDEAEDRRRLDLEADDRRREKEDQPEWRTLQDTPTMENPT